LSYRHRASAYCYRPSAPAGTTTTFCSTKSPTGGYARRALSPATGGPLELVEVSLPPGAAVSYPADAYALIHQQIWIIDGTLTLVEGKVEHRLQAGDCLQLGPPAACTFANHTDRDCRYLVALARRSGHPRRQHLVNGS
jgi:hypothetical protein